jgi:hypothetical protein
MHFARGEIEPFFSLNNAAWPFKFVTTATASIPGAGEPTGTVTFMDGSTVPGTSNLVNGTAAIVVSTLAIGIHTINASYSGGSNFNPNAAPPVSELVQP